MADKRTKRELLDYIQLQKQDIVPLGFEVGKASGIEYLMLPPNPPKEQ